MFKFVLSLSGMAAPPPIPTYVAVFKGSKPRVFGPIFNVPRGPGVTFPGLVLIGFNKFFIFCNFPILSAAFLPLTPVFKAFIPRPAPAPIPVAVNPALI